MFRQYYSSERAESLLHKPGVLAAVTFNGECSEPSQVGLIPSGLAAIGAPLTEVFDVGDAEITRGKTGRCHWSATNEIVCCALWIPAEECSDICAATRSAYLEVLSFIQTAGYPAPFRCWNYIPKINVGEKDEEEYRKFCTGRLQAFNERNVPTEDFPSASALGHHSTGAVIYLLATKEKGIQHENPKQESAYQYPRQYGPSSPSFSRATSIQLMQRDYVFVSGTASIIGHQTKSEDNLAEQINITLSNIDNLHRHIGQDAPPIATLRVYLRYKEHYTQTLDYINEHYPNYSVCYTHADVCRSDLLVEIEAFCGQPSP